jgi:hypothetical protein
LEWPETGDALSQLLFYFALEYVSMRTKEKEEGLKMNETIAFGIS